MSQDSLTSWMERLRAGDSQATAQLWDAYFRRLVGMARQRLGRREGLLGDEEDVALSAFRSFCRGMQAGQYPDVAGHADLWKLLVTITLHKTLHLLRDQQRLKRGGGWRRIVPSKHAGDEHVLDRLITAAPSPEMAAQVAEEADRLLNSLEDPELIELAVLKMEGYSNAEVAERWQKAERTVERKLRLIRTIWLAQVPQVE